VPLGALAASSDPQSETLSASDWQNIRSAYEAERYAFRPNSTNGWQAGNPAQGWTTDFDGRGFLAKPRHRAWTWGLEIQSYGYGDLSNPVAGSPEVTADGQRLTYRWDQTIQEWFHNSVSGLEHGFTLNRRPLSASTSEPGVPEPLGIVLFTRGSLSPRITDEAQGVLFLDRSGATTLSYTGLKVWDADGKILPSRFEAVGGQRVRLLVEDRAARYPITIDPIARQAYLKAGNTESQDYFGVAVDVSGDTVVIGAYGEDSKATGVNGDEADNSALDSGAAYVFIRDGSRWVQQAYLKASNTGEGDNFGSSVAVSGDTVVVGAPAESSGAAGIDGDQLDDSVPSSGAVYVFVRKGTQWAQQAYLKAHNPEFEDQFGGSVSISGNTLVVGAQAEDGGGSGADGDPADNSLSNAGAAYVFVREGTQWTQQAYLKASSPGIGDLFGGSLAISEDTLVVGAELEDSSATGVNGEDGDSATDSGAAYVFTRTGTNWAQQAYLKAGNAESRDGFGWSVALSGNTVVVGAYGEDSQATGINGDESDNEAVDSGAAYVFVRNGTQWTQQAYLKASNTGAGDFFGNSVAISGDRIVVGADLEASGATGVNGNQSDDSVAGAGAAYVFARRETAWSQEGYLKPGATGVYDLFGYKVAVSEDTVVVAAYLEASRAIGVNGDESDDSAPEAGAAYIFNGLSSGGPILRAGNPVFAANGHVELHFSEGTPGSGYRVLRSTDLDGWTPLGIVNADASGTFAFTDTTPPDAAAYYQTVLESAGN